MCPVIFDFGSFKVFGYGFFILIGTIIAYFFAQSRAKSVNMNFDRVTEMALLIVFASYIGGKVFLWFSDWDFYMQNPQKMLEINGDGFVFYGSFIFSIASLLLFFYFLKIPSAPVFDVLAICTAFVHGFGKIGCFMAGCCYGKICDFSIGVVYHNTLCQAKPLDTPLYPVQLIDAFVIFCAAIFLIWYNKRKKFTGELLLWYIFIYGTARFFTEFIRGDEDRGFVGALSQSQWVSIGLLFFGNLVYFYLKKKSSLKI